MLEVNKDIAYIQLGENNIPFIPTILFFCVNLADKPEPIYYSGLKYPVVGCCRMLYKNSIGIPYERYQNIYGEDDDYFIIFDEEKYLIPQEVINNTPVRQVLDKHGFTVNNVLV